MGLANRADDDRRAGLGDQSHHYYWAIDDPANYRSTRMLLIVICFKT
jgi:hypothetical protein